MNDNSRPPRMIDATGDRPAPQSAHRVGSNAIQRMTIGGWKPSHNNPHQGNQEIERRRRKMEQQKQKEQGQ